jgi:hypothetical protein
MIRETFQSYGDVWRGVRGENGGRCGAVIHDRLTIDALQSST